MRNYVLVGLLAAATSPLFAQVAPAPAVPVVKIAPMTAKTVTRAEVQTRVQTQFAKRDANRDGVLTAEELQMRGNKRVMVMRHGGDGPRDMQAQQAMRDPNAAFDRLDANRDGSISRDEFARGRQIRIERHRVIVDGKEVAMPDRPMGHKMHGGRGGMMGGALLKLADANNDGRVTLAEATSGALRHFDMMDSNRDGQLTPQERAAGRIHIRQMRTTG